MKVLFVYPYLPSPEAAHGSARLISRLLPDLKIGAEVSLVCGYRPGEKAWVDSVRPLCHRLYPVERRFSSDMGRIRRTTERGATGARLLGTGWPTPVVKLRRFGIRRAIRQAREETRFDLAHVELSVMAQYIESFSDLPSVLVDHEAAGPKGVEEKRWASYVREIYSQYSLVLALSDEDAAHLHSIDSKLKPLVRPPGVDVPAEAQRTPRPFRLLFFGSAEHSPNRDALRYIAEELWPMLKAKEPRLTMACAGMNGDDDPLLEFAQAQGIECLGYVDDLCAEIARAAVVLSPVREGRGVRIKNMESLARGAPLVTTSLGAQGLSNYCADGMLVADGTKKLVRSVLRLVADPAEAEAMGQRGRASVASALSFHQQAEATLRYWRGLL